MSIKWYQQHLEQIIRENQELKYEARKNKTFQTVSEEVADVFRQLFPDIPLMLSTRQYCTHEILQYYRRAVSKWLEKQKAKIEFLIRSSDCTLNGSLKLKSNQQTVSKIVGFKQINHEIIKADLEFRHQMDLLAKIQKMEAEIIQLKQQIINFQIQEQKYISQISLLRSITKKLQFQLSQKMLVEDKLKRVMIKQHQRRDQQVASLTKQALIWKDQYERIWNQSQKHKNTIFHIEKCEQETLVNTSCKDEQHGQEQNSHNNTWVIKGEDFQQSYIGNRLDHTDRRFFRVQKH